MDGLLRNKKMFFYCNNNIGKEQLVVILDLRQMTECYTKMFPNFRRKEISYRSIDQCLEKGGRAEMSRYNGWGGGGLP